MEYAVLGVTGRKVSRLGFGGATAGLKNYLSPYDPLAPDDSGQIVAAIGRAFELGVNYFDTAASYGDGAGERIFGEGLHSLPRDEFFLATKASQASGPDTRRSLERSLKNLRCDYVDLIQIHGSRYPLDKAKELLQKGGMLETLEKARDEGLVRHIGFSIESQNEALHLFINCGRFDTVQIQYNLCFQHPYDPVFKIGGMYEIEEQGLGIITMRTATSGFFQKWVQAVNPENTFDYTPPLIQLVLSNPFVDVALVGMRTIGEVEKNAEICDNLAGRIDLEKLHTRYV